MQRVGIDSAGFLTAEGTHGVANMWVLGDSWITKLQKFVGQKGVHHDMGIADYRLIWME